MEGGTQNQARSIKLNWGENIPEDIYVVNTEGLKFPSLWATKGPIELLNL
jgi:hypothetical protein